MLLSPDSQRFVAVDSPPRYHDRSLVYQVGHALFGTKACTLTTTPCGLYVSFLAGCSPSAARRNICRPRGEDDSFHLKKVLIRHRALDDGNGPFVVAFEILDRSVRRRRVSSAEVSFLRR